jgi:hypothetical protein
VHKFFVCICFVILRAFAKHKLLEVSIIKDIGVHAPPSVKTLLCLSYEA